MLKTNQEMNDVMNGDIVPKTRLLNSKTSEEKANTRRIFSFFGSEYKMVMFYYQHTCTAYFIL